MKIIFDTSVIVEIDRRNPEVIEIIKRLIENNYTVIVPKGGNAGKEGRSPGDLVINIKLK